MFKQYSEEISKGTGVDIQKVKYTDPRFGLYVNLQSDAARFATFREANKQREIEAALGDVEAMEAIERRYAEYLLTEKHTIFMQSAAAERWLGFAENADLYPNLEYRTAGDAEVRPEHARLDGIILPINDSFWNAHTPPLGFGCRCELIQTDEPVNKQSYKGYKNTPAPKGFDFNPGVEQRLFSNSAGYYANFDNSEAVKLVKEAEKFILHESYNFGKKNIGVMAKNKIGDITITEKTRGEWLNQPHENKLLKNFMIENLEFLKNLEFVSKPPSKPNSMVKQEWIAKITLKGKESVVIVKEMTTGKKILYSISDHPEKFEQYFMK